MPQPPLWSQLADMLPIAIVIAVILFVLLRGRRASVAQDGPEDEPYRVYSRDWDLELTAADIPARLRETSPDFERGRTDRSGRGWDHHQWVAQDFAGRQPPVQQLAATLSGAITQAGIAPPDLAITLLIDQSGSMRDRPIAATAAAIAAMSTALATLGVRHEILGFSTAGWHGGFVRDDWLAKGRPERPGRLCALLHLVYKGMGDTAWSAESQRAFLHPDVLRENIDGEALEWASARLAAASAQRRILLLVSDGAPVDDSTLAANGPSYLERHLLRTIARIEADGIMVLGGVGIGHAVGRYYRRSRETGLDSIAASTTELIADLICGKDAGRPALNP